MGLNTLVTGSEKTVGKRLKKPLFKRHVRCILEKMKGMQVIARNEEDEFYYRGTVVDGSNARHIEVQFHNLTQSLVPSRFVIPMIGARPCPVLRVADYVLVKTGKVPYQCWVPGMVQVTPVDEAKHDKLYTVIKFNNKTVHVLRNSIVKISKSQYKFALRYWDLQELVHQNRHHTIQDEKGTVKKGKHKDKKEKKVKHGGREGHRRHSRKKKNDGESGDKEKKSTVKSSRSRSSSRSPSRSSSRSRSRSADTIQKRDESSASENSHSRSRSISGSRSSKSSWSRYLRSHSRSSHPCSRPLRSGSRSVRSSVFPRKSRPRSSTGLKGSHARSSRSQSEPSVRSHSSKSSAKSGSHLSSERSENSSRLRSSFSDNEQTQTNDNEDDLAKNVGSKHRKLANDGNSTTGEIQKRLQELQGQLNRQQSDFLKELKKTVQNLKEVHKGYDSQHAQLQDKHSELQDKQQKLIDKQQELITKRVPTHEQSTQSEAAHPSRKEDESENKEMEESIKEEGEDRGEMKEGDEVLARWSVDGWFYRGTIENVAEDGQYFISDNVGAIEKKYIFTDKEHSDRIQNGNCVVARHPDYPFRYAPGQVRRLFPDLSCQVLFYDDEKAEVPREEIYKIDTELYGELVEYIINCEESWVGSAVVARNDEDGMYHLASIRERVGETFKFNLEWADGKVSSQFTKHIFGTFTRRQRLAMQDHVLAVAYAASSIYLPGEVVETNDGYIIVKFCDGTMSSQLDPQQCFWLSADYYNDAVQFFKNIKSKKNFKCPCCIIS